MEKGQAYIVAGTDPEPETSDADDDGVAETVSPMLKLPDVANTSLMLLKKWYISCYAYFKSIPQQTDVMLTATRVYPDLERID